MEYEPRARRAEKALIKHYKGKETRVSRIYVNKNIKYGRTIDCFDYNNVRVSFKSSRDHFGKAKEGRKRGDSIARAREKVYQIVEANKGRHGNYRDIFFTLTTKDQIKDYKESNKKIKGFIKRLSVYTKSKVKYVIVPEKHKSGAIHYHGIFFNLPFINIRVFRYELWTHGSVDLQIPRKIRNTSAYIAKYLTKDYAEYTPLHTKMYFTARGMYRPETEFTNHRPIGKMSIKSIRVGTHYQKITYRIHGKDIHFREST